MVLLKSNLLKPSKPKGTGPKTMKDRKSKSPKKKTKASDKTAKEESSKIEKSLFFSMEKKFSPELVRPGKRLQSGIFLKTFNQLFSRLESGSSLVT